MLGLFFVVLFGICTATTNENYSVRTANMPGAAGVASWFSTFSYARISPTLALVYVSGTIGSPFPSPPGPPKLVDGGAGNQTTQALKNVVGALGFAYETIYGVKAPLGHDFRRDMTKCRVYQAVLTKDQQEDFDKSYVSFFSSMQPHGPPARVSFQGSNWW